MEQDCQEGRQLASEVGCLSHRRWLEFRQALGRLKHQQHVCLLLARRFLSFNRVLPCDVYVYVNRYTFP